MSNRPVASMALKWSTSSGLATDGDMSQTSITGTPTNLEGIEVISYQATYAATGTPVGTLSFQGSNNYDAQAGTGTFVDLDSTLITGLTACHPAGVAGDHLITIDTEVFKCKFIRPKYTRTSGSGTLNMWVFGS